MILLAEAAATFSGDSQVTVALVVLVIGAAVAYGTERSNNRNGLKVLTDAEVRRVAAEEKRAVSDEKRDAKIAALESDLKVIKVTLNPPRSGSWPALGEDDR